MLASDATPAYRGYRLQALYVLSRLLSPSGDSNLVIQPEGIEDLAIFDNNNLVEVVQVKALSSKLSLSDFSPEKPGSFFHRANSLLKLNHSLKIVVASFGPIGPELRQACGSNHKKRLDVISKLEKNGLSPNEAEMVINNINLVSLEEIKLYKEVFGLLKGLLTGVDSNNAFDLLTFWLYKCSEEKSKIRRKDLIDKINKVGSFLAERYAHNAEWFKSIVPIEDYDVKECEELAQQFFQGVSAEYGHILADLDIRRITKMEKINEKFKDNRVLIIHGASGQGKTTLAYRYVHDYFPSCWRFEIKFIENRKHAISIATALIGHVNAIGIPIVVYVDVAPNDDGWPELVEQLSRHSNINVLVTVREEDWRKASIRDKETKLSEMDLYLDRQEAELIYQALAGKNQPTEFLNFADAWDKFGSEGPLMEFIYLITHGRSIKERLKQQIDKLQDEARQNPEKQVEIELIKLVSVTSAYQARLKVKSLVDYLRLPAPKRTFELLEKEYMLRLYKDGSLVGGLHPIRSTIIADLLTDPAFTSWIDNIIACLPIMYEPDINNFLIILFSRRRGDTERLLDFLSSYQPSRWGAIAGVMKALIQLGLIEYYEENRLLIQEVFEKVGNSWKVVFDPDISGAMPGIESPIRHGLIDISQEGRKQIEAWNSRLTDKKICFRRISNWLSTRTTNGLTMPQYDDDWESFAEVLFWAGHLKIHLPIEGLILDSDFENQIETLPLEILANIFVGLYEGYKEKYFSLMQIGRAKLIDKLRKEMQILILEDDNTTLKAHFFIKYEHFTEHGPNLNSEAMKRIQLLRRFFPNREFYSCQGYGHKLLPFEQPFDETFKKIKRDTLPLNWLVSVNRSFIDYVEMQFRPENWGDYTKLMINLRVEVLGSLKSLRRILKNYFRSQKYVGVYDKLDLEKWKRCGSNLSKPPSLPICAFEESGLRDELSLNAFKVDQNCIISYELYLNNLRTYTFSLSNFFDQSIHAMILNPILGRKTNNDTDKSKIIDLYSKSGIKTDLIRLSYINLCETVEILEKFQKSFRQLFEKFIENESLENLEKSETKLFHSFANLWYSFVFSPNTRTRGLCGDKMCTINETFNLMRRNLEKEIRELSTDDLKISIISDKVPWDQEPTLWLLADGEIGLDIYNNVTNIYFAIQRAFNTIENMELRSFVLETHWKYVAIIPSIGGKFFTPTAWRMYSNVLSTTSKIDWWNLYPHRIPENIFNKLSLSIWTLDELDLAFKFLQSIAEASIIGAHIKDFEQLKDIDAKCFGYIQEYIQYLVKQMEAKCQFALKNGTEMLAIINKIPRSEYCNHPCMVEIIKNLKELYKYILPKDNCSGEIIMNLSDLISWSDKLEKGRSYAFIVYLLWISEILNKPDS
jgi:hypothetical protein